MIVSLSSNPVEVKRPTAGLTNQNDVVVSIVSRQNLNICLLTLLIIVSDQTETGDQSVNSSISHSITFKGPQQGRCNSGQKNQWLLQREDKSGAANPRTRPRNIWRENEIKKQCCQSEIKTETSRQNVQHLCRVKHQLSGSLNHSHCQESYDTLYPSVVITLRSVVATEFQFILNKTWLNVIVPPFKPRHNLPSASASNDVIVIIWSLVYCRR